MDTGGVSGLLVSARAGGAWAFERLYALLAPAVVGYLRTQGADDPEDLANEVFVSVFRGLGSFEGDERAFRSWVFTIAHHRLVDDRRRRSRRVVAERLEAHHDCMAGDAEDEAMAALGDQRVAAMLAALSPDQRDVLALRVVADLSIEQTAKILGKRATAVKALQRRALAALHTKLSKEAVSQ